MRRRARLIAAVARRLAHVVAVLVLMAGMLQQGGRYFFCSAMQEAAMTCCCPPEEADECVDGEEGLPAQFKEQPCCESRSLGALPRTATTAAETPAPPRLQAEPMRACPFEVPSRRPERRVRQSFALVVATGPPRRQRHAQLMVFLI